MSVGTSGEKREGASRFGISVAVKSFFVHNTTAATGVVIIIAFASIGVLAPVIAPFRPLERHYNADAELRQLERPSSSHWLGTTLHGRDVFSQLVVGTRMALLVGLLTAFFVALIGVNVGLVAGYYGGGVDNVLMRLTDIVASVPILPFAIVGLSILSRSVWWTIIVMSILYWTTTARVVRAQVLTLRERPFVDAARISGTRDIRLLYKHIAPNVLPQALVHGAFSVSWAITTEASLAFLGFGDPFAMSWGSMIYDVFTSMVIHRAWWWFLPPGICIMLLVMSFYFLGRAFEERADPRLRTV
ncbi:MAG TPA: ABC transporter permease [Vicinamibacteria bacterium]|nr:ABC transporter permease [Vicinamibacteria bacterium]